jgi:DNA-binding winged helix-turn-helix (wHTH) protein
MSVRFGDVRLDSDARRLWRGGSEVHLSPKALELLALLLERRPAAVSKTEIQERLWPSTFVSEASLPSLVSEIREAIDDTAKTPRFIRTLYGFGYSFVGDVVQEPGPADGPPAGAVAHWLLWEGGRVPLEPGENLLGAEGAGPRAIVAATVSRRHAVVRIVEDTALLDDLGSKNGTYVNDERVTASRTLSDGDRVRLGSVLLTYRHRRPGASTETQTPRPVG